MECGTAIGLPKQTLDGLGFSFSSFGTAGNVSAVEPKPMVNHNVEFCLKGLVLCSLEFPDRFQCAQLPNQVLENISIIDTPGILTAAKRRLSRGEATQSNKVTVLFSFFSSIII